MLTKGGWRRQRTGKLEKVHVRSWKMESNPGVLMKRERPEEGRIKRTAITVSQRKGIFLFSFSPSFPARQLAFLLRVYQNANAFNQVGFSSFFSSSPLCFFLLSIFCNHFCVLNSTLPSCITLVC